MPIKYGENYHLNTMAVCAKVKPTMNNEEHIDSMQGEQARISEELNNPESVQRQEKIIKMIARLDLLSKELRGHSGILDEAAVIVEQSAQLHAEELQLQEKRLPEIVDLPLPDVPNDISAIHPAQSINKT
jgi:hypothetical protein